MVHLGPCTTKLPGTALWFFHGQQQNLPWTSRAVCRRHIAPEATNSRGEAAKPPACPSGREKAADKKKIMAASKVGQVVLTNARCMRGTPNIKKPSSAGVTNPDSRATPACSPATSLRPVGCRFVHALHARTRLYPNLTLVVVDATAVCDLASRKAMLRAPWRTAKVSALLPYMRLCLSLLLRSWRMVSWILRQHRVKLESSSVVAQLIIRRACTFKLPLVQAVDALFFVDVMSDHNGYGTVKLLYHGLTVPRSSWPFVPCELQTNEQGVVGTL